MRLKEQARGRWPMILSQYGIPDQYLKDRHGPCPLCGGKDRYRFDNKDGNGTYYCNQCGPGDGMDLLIRYTDRDFKSLAKELEDKLPGKPEKTQAEYREENRQEQDRRKKSIDKIRSDKIPVRFCEPVMEYLQDGRGLKPTSKLCAVEKLPYYEDGIERGIYPAMAMPIISSEGKLCSYHLTYVDGLRKAPVRNPKKVMKPIRKITGGAIRLTDIYEHIGIAEGIETALAVMMLYKVPCWSVIATSGMESFRPPEGVKAVTVYSDNDANFSGQRAAYLIANKLSLDGYQVDVQVPSNPHSDYAEVLESYGQ